MSIDESALRTQIIRFAHARPEFRDRLLPLLKVAGRVRVGASAKRLKRDIQLKDGTIVLKNTLVTVEFDPDHPSLAILKIAGQAKPVKVSTINLEAYLPGFKTPPSRATLRAWAARDICQTVTGKTVAVDGWGPDGSPSWLLVLNMLE